MTKRTEPETPPPTRTEVDFLGYEREMKGGNERAINDKSFTFRCHVLLIKEELLIKKEDTKENQMRQHKLILHHQETPQVLLKVGDVSHAPTTFCI